MDNSGSQANNCQQSASPENSPLVSRLQRRQGKSAGVINTRQLHRHYQSTQATTARLTQRSTLPQQINSRYGSGGLQPKLNLERFSRPRVESADVSNTYLEQTNFATSGRGKGVQRSIVTTTNSRQFPSNLGHQGRAQPPSPSVQSTSPKVVKSSTQPTSSSQPRISLPRQVKINRQATLSALQNQFTSPGIVQSKVVPPKTESGFHSPSPVTQTSTDRKSTFVQTKSIVVKPSPTSPTTTTNINLTKETASNNSAQDLLWRSQEEEASETNFAPTQLSDSKHNQDISLVQTKSIVVKPSPTSPTTTLTETGKTTSAPDLVWRKTERGAVAKVLKPQQLSAYQHNQQTSLSLATQPVKSDGVIARQNNVNGANYILMTAPVTSTTDTSNLPTTPASGVDVDIEAIAEQVSRILTRQLTVEQERRGIEKWH